MKTTLSCIRQMLLALLIAGSANFITAASPETSGEGLWIARANNAFAVDLLGELAAKESENLFFSPNSIETALAMTCAGARGATADQMAKVLHLPPKDGDIHRDFGRFLRELNASKTADGKARGYELSVANALWGQKGYPFLRGFVSLLRKNYGAGLEEVDYEHDSEGAREKINAWVEKKTRDRIKDLIGQGVLKPTTRLVLTNAIYFKGSWAEQFAKEATREEPFHLSAGRQKTVHLMHRTGRFDYMETDTVQALKLPYAGDDLSMIVLLPRKVDGLAALERFLSPDQLSEWFSELARRRVEVFLPRFKVTAQFELNSTLTALGMSDAFDAARADFSGMTGNRDLMLSNVIHKAFVEVNEEGTEAAAATGAVIALTSAPLPPPVFRADHPFLFVIREEKSGAMLFVGRLADPAP